ncbi:Non-haem bromoperoxidase BPO-A2 [Nocardia farcinica]|uniref:Non-haem bromoperoxidase BPO-A2 n=1 Tax=Nocardia farcinica TaxID=37329 RepID=A0A449GGU7_NOCFR|nr:alpha/beta hydrolase [Nocardia farcinica]VFA91918.1 Non-haem bromoperoxidase BPO-A2 [Nocardia farcinica]
MSNANYLLEPQTLRLRGSGGLELAADLFGPEDGPLVIFLHGGGQTRHSWKRTGAALAAGGLRVVTLDARGHGDSQWAPDRDYSRAVMVADLLAVLDQLGATPERGAVVVGASMGGITGLLATAQPGGAAIRALVLVDIVTRPQPEGVERVMTFLGKHRDGFDTVEQAADAVAAYLPHRPRPKNHDGLLRNLRHRDGRWYWHWDPDMIDGRAADADTDSMAALLEPAARALTIPVLLVRGRMSDVVSEEAVAEFLEQVPHAQVVEIGNAAHTAASDDNDAFTDAVAEFVLAAAR